MEKEHNYTSNLKWTGNLGKGTSAYSEFSRDYSIEVDGKPPILGSSDAAFLGDISRHNPEELLLVSISSCHMLWFLHLCSLAKVVVIDYTDQATGTMIEKPDGSGAFSEVILYPKVIVAEPLMAENIDAIHTRANQMCFIANSLNFPIRHKGTCAAITEVI